MIGGLGVGVLERVVRRWRTHRPMGGLGMPRGFRVRWKRFDRRPSPWLLPLVVSLLLAALVISLFQLRLRPIAVTLAKTQAENTISAKVEQIITEDLARRGISYSSFVKIQRDSSGGIISMTTDMAAMNLLRSELLSQVLNTLSGIEISRIQIPLGSLLDLNLLWGLGPTMKVHVMTAGTIEGEFVSSFSSAGVNQTLHQIYLELTVPLTLMLPGGPAETTSKTRLCVAETVIVGHVPDTYLQFAQP